MRSGGPGFARTSAIAVLAALLASAVCGSAMGQSAREPILVSVDGPAVTFVGRVPWRIGDDLSWSQPDLDDATWGTMPVPSYWHSEGLDASDRVAWYRVHVRLPDGPRPDLGMTMPPASAA